MRTLVNRYALALYFALSMLISWLLWLPAVMQQEKLPTWVYPLFFLGGFGPFLAALAVMALSGNKNLVNNYKDRLFHLSLPWRWYAVALLLPPLLTLAANLLIGVLGGNVQEGSLLPPVLSYPLLLVTMIILGGGQEELGWRGFALPLLLERFRPLQASVMLGVFWMIWHVPLFFGPALSQSKLTFWLYFINGIALAALFTWFYLKTGGSILMAVLLHGGINTALNWYPMDHVGGIDAFLPITVATVILAAAVLLGSRGSFQTTTKTTSHR